LFLSEGNTIKIRPEKPEGLVHATADYQYAVPRQLYKPLIAENEQDEDDFRYKHTLQDKPYSHKYAQLSRDGEFDHDKLPYNQQTFHRYGLVRDPYDR